MALGLCAIAGGKPMMPKPTSNLWWVLLERTRAPWPEGKTAGLAVEKGHADNLQRLAKLKKLVTVGRIRDVGGPLRNSLILKADGPKALMSCFASDPYIQEHVMAVRAMPVAITFGTLHQAPVMPKGMDANLLVMYVAAKPMSPAMSQKHRAYLVAGAVANQLGLEATTTTEDKIRDLAVFKTTDQTALKSWISGDPAIKSGALKAVVYPQWFLKGAL